MNEVTRIHLGRQPFTIAADAHKALETYLAEIKHAVGDKSGDVVKEVELRMAELLGERGVSGDKVILLDDVKFLKQQLGDPQDFKEDDEATPTATTEGTANKRLFRDTDNGIIAGVGSGLASYFGLDVLLVRIVIIITVLAGGWGILLYIALWLLIPEAKSSSERLQMRGVAVTVDNLKQVVERADIHGTAHRAGGALRCGINSALKLALKITGIALILAALIALFALVAAGIYLELHDGSFFREGFFPIGGSEHLLVVIAFVWVGLLALFLVLIGIALVRRKWPIATWTTGVIAGLLFIGLAAGIALSADTVPKVRQRYEAAHHSATRSVEPFSSIQAKGDHDVIMQHGDSYSVTMRYFGNADISKIKTSVVNHQLIVDSSQFKWKTNCDTPCLFPDYNLEITVYSPTIPDITSPGRGPDQLYQTIYQLQPPPVVPAIP